MASCSSKIGIVDEALMTLNNSTENYHTQKSRQTNHNNPYKSQASTDSLSNALKSSKADSNQNGLVSPSTRQSKVVNAKIVGDGKTLRSSKAFMKL